MKTGHLKLGSIMKYKSFIVIKHSKKGKKKAIIQIPDMGLALSPQIQH